MANLTETTTYDAGVYQIETADPVQGGPSGVSNTPAKALANRTNYLKKHVDDLESGATVPAGMAPLNTPGFTGSPTCPTAPLGDDSTKLANTAFVQKSIAGELQKNVAGNGNVTLTAIEAGNGVLNLFGALTGNISVIVPAVPHKFTVFNNTTGSFTLAVKTASGSGVDVQQGKWKSLVSLSSGVFPDNNEFNNVALTGSPTAPVPASGNNDSGVATTSFVFNAVDGFASVNVSGGSNVALSATQAGTAIINLVGALAANISVIVPAQSGQWVFVNGTTGGFAITVKMATGSGVVLPISRAAIVYCDGTNVAFANDRLSWGGITGSISNQTDLENALNSKAASSHQHPASDINSGVFATARLGVGTANSNVYLRGDGTWAVVPAAAAPTWGSIAGTLSNQTDLQAALNSKSDTGHSHAAPTWGIIGGTLSNQTDLQNALNTKSDGAHTHTDKASLSGASFTGQVNAPVFNTTSSLRYKKDIAVLDANAALALLVDIELVSYRLKADDSVQYGVVAENLADGPLDFAVVRNEQGQPDAVNYQALFVLASCALQGVVGRLERVESELWPVN